MDIEIRERRITEQMLSNDHDVYSAEDDMFLYYCRDNKLHVVRGSTDYSMSVNNWERFAHVMLAVDDEYFITGKGAKLRNNAGFLGGYLSKYDRRNTFAMGLLDIINDAKRWDFA